MKIALAGNPNSGKTTLFNALTGKIEHVGNWPGVTVEKKEGSIKRSLNGSSEKMTVVDLPGAYSCSPYTQEESITKDFVMKEQPDVILNIVDATNLSRSLFFTSQLLELGIPVVVALNKSDLNVKQKTVIDTLLLSEKLHCPVVDTVATKGGASNGLSQLVQAIFGAYLSKEKQRSLGIRNAQTAATKEEVQKVDEKRFKVIASIVKEVERRNVHSSSQKMGDAIDRVVAHKWLGIPIFVLVIWFVFSLSQSWLGPFLADFFVGLIDGLYALVDSAMGDSVNPVLHSLLLDGIIGGVGAVIGFLPLIMVLFFTLALLEDVGYMARVAVVMDRFFKKIGLSGKSIIPMIVSTGCAIPGVMATRTIKNERQRRTTAMLSPFMPCGAKLPIIALFSGIFFNENSWVGTSMYMLAIIVVIVSGLVIRKITGDTSQSYFIMELPEYRVPSVKRAALSMLNRAKAFIIKAGTIILVCNAVVQLLQTFNWSFQVVGESNPGQSILASIASPIAFLFIPLGFGIWQFAAAAITGFIAKENVVGTLAVTFAITNFIDVEELALVGGTTEVMAVFGIGSVAALAYLVFNLFTPPCFAAIGAMNAELESKKWLFGAIGYQLGTGYTLAFFVYQFGTLFTTGSFGTAFVPGLIAVAAMIGFIIYLIKRPKAVQSVSRTVKVGA
ncbi:MAG: ferrous iron transport protein B [Sphaerochaetaceae bacterium]|nr:ferrous iron transport protein B [Sphaerochaetaceae bacterium]